MGREHRHVAVRRPDLLELLGRSGEEQLVERLAPAFAQTRELVLGQGTRRRLPRTALDRLGPERLRPATRRVAELAVQEADDRGRDVEPLRVGGELGGVGADGDQVQRQVADDLGRRGHLHDVAEDPVGGGVHVLDLLELLAEAQRDRLLAQVGELARRGSRGCRRGRSGRAARTRTARTPGGPPPSRAPARRRPRGTGRSRAASGRWRRPAPTAEAARWCRPSRRWPRRRRRPPRRSRPAGWRADRPGCRGCAGAPAGRTPGAARSPGSGPPAPAAARPCP